MKTLTMTAAAVLALATVAPAMAQATNPDTAPTRPARRLAIGRPGPNQPDGGSPGYQANTYVRRPSSRTPTDVGNMQFPDPSETPAGSLPAVPVGR